MPKSKAPVRTADTEMPARDLLLNAASELMIEVGTFDVSLHAIARKAGVTAPLVKYYYGGKEGLLIALAERDTERSLAQLEDLIAMDIDPVSKLRIHVTGIIRTYAKFPYLNGLLDSLMRDTQSAGSARIRDGFVLPLMDAQRRIIEEGVRAGKLREIDPTFAYFIIVGACQYVFSTRVSGRGLIDGRPVDSNFARDYATQTVEIVLNGLAKR